MVSNNFRIDVGCWVTVRNELFTDDDFLSEFALSYSQSVLDEIKGRKLIVKSVGNDFVYVYGYFRNYKIPKKFIDVVPNEERLCGCGRHIDIIREVDISVFDFTREINFGRLSFINNNDISIPSVLCDLCVDNNISANACFVCDCCGHLFLIDDDDNNGIEFNDNYLCVQCFENDYFRCEDCGNVYNNEDLSECEGSNVCSDCYDNDSGNNDDNGNRTPNDFFTNNCKIMVEYPKRRKSVTVFGVEIETVTPYNADLGNDAFSFFKRVGDGSINYDSRGVGGIEYVSTPLTINKVGFKVLEDFSREAIKNKIFVNSSCGLHIHINIKNEDRNIDTITKVISFYKKFENEFFKMLPKSRSNNNYCRMLNSNFFKENCRELELDSLKKEKDLVEFKKKFYGGNLGCEMDKYFGKRYYWVNIHSLFHRGTIEIRSHSATIDHKKIVAWIKIHKRCLDFILKSDLEKIESLDTDGFYKLFDRHLNEYIRYRQNLFMDRANSKAISELYSSISGLNIFEDSEGDNNV